MLIYFCYWSYIMYFICTMYPVVFNPLSTSLQSNLRGEVIIYKLIVYQDLCHNYQVSRWLSTYYNHGSCNNLKGLVKKIADLKFIWKKAQFFVVWVANCSQTKSLFVSSFWNFINKTCLVFPFGMPEMLFLACYWLQLVKAGSYSSSSVVTRHLMVQLIELEL